MRFNDTQQFVGELRHSLEDPCLGLPYHAAYLFPYGLQLFTQPAHTISPAFGHSSTSRNTLWLSWRICRVKRSVLFSFARIVHEMAITSLRVLRPAHASWQMLGFGSVFEKRQVSMTSKCSFETTFGEIRQTLSTYSLHAMSKIGQPTEPKPELVELAIVELLGVSRCQGIMPADPIQWLDSRMQISGFLAALQPLCSLCFPHDQN
jgi:hypothetical protein